MADLRKGVECSYCGVTFHIKFPEDVSEPTFCCFCSESLNGPVEDETDDGDLDYIDDDRDETENFN